MKRERHHRGFIRAFLFDMVFKAFMNILDEALCQKEIYIAEKRKEWEYQVEKRMGGYEEEIENLKLKLRNTENHYSE